MSRSRTFNSSWRFFEHASHQRNDKIFRHALHFFQIGVSHFGLDHPKFGEVTTSLGFFGAERGAEAIHFAEGHSVGFVVKLAGLRQVNFFVFEVIHFKERGGAFAGGWREDGRVYQREAMRIEVIANAFHNFVANANRGMLPAAAQPKMTMVHQEIDAVFFGSDRIRVLFRHALDDVRAVYVKLETAMRPGFRADCSGNGERTLLR